MTPIEKLHVMLSDHGMECVCDEQGRQLWWDFGDDGHAFAVQDGEAISIAITGATPTNAVDATCEKGTCKTCRWRQVGSDHRSHRSQNYCIAWGDGYRGEWVTEDGFCHKYARR